MTEPLTRFSCPGTMPDGRKCGYQLMRGFKQQGPGSEIVRLTCPMCRNALTFRVTRERITAIVNIEEVQE